MIQAAVRLSLSCKGVLRKMPRAFASPPVHHTHTSAQTRSHVHVAPRTELDFGNVNWVFRHKTTRELMRGLLVLHACAVDPLVTHSYKLMKFGQRLMGERVLGLLMAPFYYQFVAGNTEAELGRVSGILADVGVRLMVAPMLETDLGEGVDEQEMYLRNLTKTLLLVGQSRRQSVLGGSRPVCQTKMTAHLTADVLKRVSDAYQSLSLEGKVKAVATLGDLMVEEVKAKGSSSSSSPSVKRLLLSLPLQETDAQRLISCLPRLHQLGWHCVVVVAWLQGRRCRDDGVVLAVDAEWTYTNPAINLMTLALMHIFNRGEAGEIVRPVIWNTYQGYLKAAVENLQEDLAVASLLGSDVSFGAKLVRGAYMERERAWAAEQGHPDPVNDTYEDTCTVYNRMVRVMLEEVARAGAAAKLQGTASSRAVMVATHNEESVVRAAELVGRLGLDPQGGDVVFAQVYGMAENISVPLAAAGFLVYKSVPVGTVGEVLPYLSRRAAENRAVMRGARRERQLLAKELAARVTRRG
ncbi:hydroxyproline dehydrogenase-like [Scylla paramamosain]|uniref:hydroxyproline dehydrogenase-like n=1 Tax=Scylla paramamosain TaxID=85552 RepID=UPI003083E2FA